MYARIEVCMKPEFTDPSAQSLMRRLELAHPDIRRKVRWARWIDLYWLELSTTREELIPAVGEIFFDPVLQWLFTGNLIPSAAAKYGDVLDLMHAAPHRPGVFWGIERRFRPGVTDNSARTSLEAFEIVLGRKQSDARAASGSLILFEGPELTEEMLSVIARDTFCNELIETWTVLPEIELTRSDRFRQERIKRDLPQVNLKGVNQVTHFDLSKLKDVELDALSRRKTWALNLAEMKAIRDYYARPEVAKWRGDRGLGTVQSPTDVEIEIIAQTWSEHCKHKIFGANIQYTEKTVNPSNIPARIESLFKTTISGTTSQLPKEWLLSVFTDNAGILAFDEDDAFCIKVETHNSPSALDPYGGSLTGIVGVNRDILGCGLGARPIFNLDVFCLATPDYAQALPERLLHPRRILDGARRGVEHGGNKSGIPTVNGALVFDDRYLGKPLIYVGTGGFMPRMVAGRRTEIKEVRVGDHVCMVGGRIGKDGIHGATFSSLALDESSPATAVQLGDPITQKRMSDFLLEARDHDLYRAITDNGAGGLSSSVGEMAQISGGARIDVAKAKTKYPGLKPFELMISESQERMTVAVPPEKLALFLTLADRRSVEVSDLGIFNDSGYLEVLYEGKPVGCLELEFLHKGVPKLELTGHWKGVPELPELEVRSFEGDAGETLLALLGRPNIASKEWLIRQYDHEVQGTSVVKPLHSVHVGTPQASSGPNDGGVVKPKPNSISGIAVGVGVHPKLSDYDCYLMAQAAVDEAVRNVLAVGAEYGRPESVLALVDNFCWPDPVGSPDYTADLVRACFGLRDAALELSAPLVSGKDSMKNDYRGYLVSPEGEHSKAKEVKISVPPTLLMTAVAKVADTRLARTADFKSVGDQIYLLGSAPLGLVASELHAMRKERGGGEVTLPCGEFSELDPAHASGNRHAQLPQPNWEEARRLYQWLGFSVGREQARLKSAHDVSEGGMLVAISEGMMARGLGAWIQMPKDMDPWLASFGEGFHRFVVTMAESDAMAVESEWSSLGIPFQRLGTVTSSERLEARWGNSESFQSWMVPVKSLQAAWRKEGYWD